MRDSKQYIDRPRAPRGGSAAVIGAAFLSVLAAGAVSASCRGEAGGERRDEPAAEARAALGGAQTCVTLRRVGASGTVLDAQIADKLPPKNYGGSQTMNAGPILGEERQSLIQFDLSSVTLPAHAVAAVTSATFSITQAPLGSMGPGTIEVHRITAPWSELAVTWQSFAGAFSPIVVASASNAPSTLSFDVTQLVSDWLNGVSPNHGLALVQPGANATNFWSSEVPTVASRPALDVCYALACAPGFDDCDGAPANGCETPITTVTDCGACGVACAAPNGTPACAAGACAIGACNLGFGDCDGAVPNGCETMLTTGADCGACGVPCALPNATSTCATGTCALVACDPGFYDCDGDPQNGCEPLLCPDGSRCNAGAICQSGVCQGGFCASPSCSDAAQNGSETDVDCGGGACPPCAAGLHCGAGADCQSGVCAGGVCQAPACGDVVKNGAETDVDCGGGACPPCDDGEACLVGADCSSGVCTGGACQAPACNDGAQNGAETAIDCGGGACVPCNPGQACLLGSDCTTSVCAGAVCQMASCSDGVQNGSETDVDCGGACPDCLDLQRCQTSADCVNMVCVGGVCQPPTCLDGVRNGDETGVDCGGSCVVPETCNGLDDDCDGEVDEGLGTITCGLGACQVTVPACAGGQPQTCTPRAATAEICDGLVDDDCDGVVDNGCACANGQTQSCYTGAPATLGVGVCAAGTQTCAHGQWGACQGQVTPNAEVCDGLDNDCDGQTDEGLGQTVCGTGACQVVAQNCVNGQPNACVPASPSAEVCDGVDNDCDGAIDEGLGTVSCGLGDCARTAPACVNGAPGTCAPGAPQAEVCDGADNDCDGVIDEGNPGGGASCQTGQLGVCAAGTTACAGAALACNRNQGPSTEVCNGLDDDCDGQVDEGNPGGGASCSTGLAGICATGTTICSGGGLACAQTQPPRSETCNGLDDDCDGQVDEDNVCGTCGGTSGGGTATGGVAGGGVAGGGTQSGGAQNGGVVGGATVTFTSKTTSGNAECAAVGRTCVQASNNGGNVSCTTATTFGNGSATCNASASGAGVTWSGKTTSGNQECAAVGRACTQAYRDGTSTSCSTSTSATNGAALCGAPSGAGVSWGSKTTSGNAECAAVGRACTSTWRDGTSSSCTTSQSFTSGSAQCGASSAGSGITWGSKQTSGNQECAALGLSCVQAYDAGQSTSCTFPKAFTSGAALCVTSPAGWGVSWSNKATSGNQECAALGRSCTNQYVDGSSWGCSASFSSGNGAALCGGATGTVGITWGSKTTSGNAECAAIGKTCSSTWRDGTSSSCNSATSFAAGAALCVAASAGAGITWGSKATSGNAECAALGLSCIQAHDAGQSTSCSFPKTFTSGVALCATAPVGSGVTWVNKTTSGNAECAAVGRLCEQQWVNGSSWGCAASFSSGNGAAMCSTCSGSGLAWGAKTTSGNAECAAVGRTCVETYRDGVISSCNVSTSFVTGAAICGAPSGPSAVWANKTTSGNAECAAIGRSCVQAYDDGQATACSFPKTFGSGIAACGAAIIGQGTTWANEPTSGNAECAAIGRTCTQQWVDGSPWGCSASFSSGNGVALCAASATGTGTTWANKTTSGNAECAAVGRACTATYRDGVTSSCNASQAAVSGAALCAASATGSGVTWSGKTTSGNAECALAGRTCVQAYDDGLSTPCSFPRTFGNGVVLCSSNVVGTGKTWSGLTTNGNTQCATLGQACVQAYEDGSAWSCGATLSYDYGVALCQ